MDYIIVMDSCGERTEGMRADEHIVSAPLTMQVDEFSVIDDDTFDQADFLKKVAASPNSPKSACPSPDYYKEAFEKSGKRAYAVTLSAELSGSYNSAVLAKELLLEERPDMQIHVFNSRSASIGETLITHKIMECEAAGMEFEALVDTVEAYIESQNTYFVLENLETLRKNGRLSAWKAAIASTMRIKPVCKGEKGEIAQSGQAIGSRKALAKMVESVLGEAARLGRNLKECNLVIAHCNCFARAEYVKGLFEAKAEYKAIYVNETSGLSSLYANDGGIIVSLA